MKVDTFVFVHDQSIVLDFDRIGKFSGIENLRYVFLGERPVDSLYNRHDVIIARDLEGNIEHMRDFVAFTGWYLIWKNRLSDADFINLFEYDVILCEGFGEKQKSILVDKNVVGYQAINVHDYWYVGDEQCSGTLLRSLDKVYGIDYVSLVSGMPHQEIVSITSNHTFSRETFDSFMQWFDPLVDLLKYDNMCGHFPERAVSIYCKTNQVIGVCIDESLLKHYRLDSHGTGGRDAAETSELYTEMVSNKSNKMRIGVVMRGFHKEKYTDYNYCKENFIEFVLGPLSKHDVSVYLCTNSTSINDLIDFYKPKRIEIVDTDADDSDQRTTFLKSLKLVENEDLDFVYVLRFDTWFYQDISKMIDFDKINFTQRLDPPEHRWNEYGFVSDLSFFFPMSHLNTFAHATKELIDNPPRAECCMHGIYKKISGRISESEIHFMNPIIWRSHGDDHSVNDVLRVRDGEAHFASVCGW